MPLILGQCRHLGKSVGHTVAQRNFKGSNFGDSMSAGIVEHKWSSGLTGTIAQ